MNAAKFKCPSLNCDRLSADVSDAARPRKGPSLPNRSSSQARVLLRLMWRTTGIKEIAMPIQPLRDSPSLENLRKRAKALANAVRSAESAALERVR
jgi:hypothetical protein